MRLRVRLYGTLARDLLGESGVSELRVELPNGSRVRDLLAHLGIPSGGGEVVIGNNRVLSPEARLRDTASVSVFQALAGG
ncbi:MAG: MoaD/ThiS family protein [Desulfobacteraceae bacterium]|jgi:sulfur carrier protein ThiS